MRAATNCGGTICFMDILDSTTTQGAIVGATLAPYFAALLRQCNFSRETNGVITLLVYAALGVIIAAVNGELNPQDLGSTFAAVAVASQLSYNLIAKESANRLEAKTSPTPPSPEQVEAARQRLLEQRLDEIEAERERVLADLGWDKPAE